MRRAAHGCLPRLWLRQSPRQPILRSLRDPTLCRSSGESRQPRLLHPQAPGGEDPHLLVVEDLHWIDSETQAWLDLLVESLPTARLLLLLNYRPE
jgi:hypothetical protein